MEKETGRESERGAGERGSGGSEGEAEKRRGRGERGERERGEGEEGGERWFLSYIIIYLHVPSYTLIYLYITSDTPKYFLIPSYTPIYFKITNIRNTRADMRFKNGHNSSPRAVPKVRIWHKAFFMFPEALAHQHGTQIYLFYKF